MFAEKLKRQGYIIKSFKDKDYTNIIRRIIKKHFSKHEEYYCKISRDKFSKIALKCQNEINRSEIIKKFHLSEKDFLSQLLPKDTPMYSSSGYLRVVRPSLKKNNTESLSWHRETFYSNRKTTYHAINVWFPVSKVDNKNMLKYIPKSHLISDKKIKRRRVKVLNNKVKKLSPEHKLGFVYATKKILSGVNLKKQKKFKIKNGEFTAFSALLVHGNGENTTNKIRYAFGFGIIPKSKVNSKKIDSKNNTYIEF